MPELNMESLIALLTLTTLEVVLGVDNVVFIAILVAKLPAEKQEFARKLGLGLAMVSRLLLLLALGWVMGLTKPLFSLSIPGMQAAHAVSGRDLILLIGGLFLIAKATYEIHEKLEVAEHDPKFLSKATFRGILVQIILLDIVFSLDSVITAVGMARHISIMMTAVIIAVAIMMFFARAISDFVERHPTVKMLALSFLLLIGVTLVVEGLHGHIAKGYIYFAMAFSLMVEMLNLRLRKRADPVHLHQKFAPPEGSSHHTAS